MIKANEHPLILAFDTSDAYCAAALLSGDTILEETFESMKKGQAERLMYILEEMLDRHTFTYQDLDAIGVGTGPGNFTGIRIGVSAARGLALGLNIPAYGIDGFDQRATLNPATEIHCIPAPREQYYVRTEDRVALLSPEEFTQLGLDKPNSPSPNNLAKAIAIGARARWPDRTPAPAPYYVRAPDAAPPKNVAPTILI